MLSQAVVAAMPALANYAHTAWNGQRGAPADVVQFTQTLDGWLWISSPHGLFRFDGADFEKMESVQGHRLHTDSTLGLLTTRDGRLWVGGRFGGISVFGAGRARLFTEADGLPKGAVLTMTEGPDGGVWVATGTGLGHLAPGATRFRRVGEGDGLPEKLTRQILYGRDGRQWVALDGGIYFRDPGQARYRRAWPYIDLMAMAEAPDGTLWGSDGVNKHYRVLSAPPPGNPPPRAELGGNGALFDRDGNMWILKVNALERRQAPYVGKAADARQLTRDNGMSGPLPQTVFEDREGNLWIGTSAGLDRLRRTRLRAVPVATAFDSPGVIADDDGGVIIGDWRHPLRRYNGAGARESLGRFQLNSAYRAPDGALWLANFAERRRLDATGAFTRLPHPPHLAGPDTQAMTIDAGGRMWISMSRHGLFRIDGGAWRKDGGLPGLPDALTLALATDRGGRVWAGYLNNRIALIDGERVRVFGEADGLRLGNVQSLLVDGARLWAGGQNGLAWHDGQRWHSATPAGGRRLRGISGMVRTGAGELWLYGAEGISRVAAGDVERLLREPGGRCLTNASTRSTAWSASPSSCVPCLRWRRAPTAGCGSPPPATWPASIRPPSRAIRWRRRCRSCRCARATLLTPSPTRPGAACVCPPANATCASLTRRSRWRCPNGCASATSSKATTSIGRTPAPAARPSTPTLAPAPTASA